MFRRSRFSVRPKVGNAGRTATPQETPAASQEPSEIPKESGENKSAIDVTDKSDGILSEKGEGNEQNGEGTNSSAALQRRKRFSVKPKVAPGRTPALSRTPNSPVKPVSATSVEVPSTDISKPSTSSQAGTSAVLHGLQSPRRRRHSEDNKQHKMQPKLALISPEHSGPSPVETAEDSPEQTPMSADGNKEAEQVSCSQVKDIPARLPDKVPPSLPDKEASEISEKAKTLVSSKNVLSLSPSALSLSRLLNSPSDLQRLVKAQKLRELLRQERCKEKKLKKAKIRTREFTLDPTKMTMRDLIHYLPTSNPMLSSLEDSAQENETVVPPSPGREESPERAQEPEVQPTKVSSGEEEAREEEVAAEEEVDEEALMVPQVKVAEDGSLIIDEDSLTVEVQRAKGPNPAQDREPIFERGSTTTYSSFRKGTYTKPWSIEETDMFFLAVSMVGTDFSMICQLFPHRARSEIKNKFKKEERQNSWRIDKAFRERRKLDIEYFSKLLEKVLEVQKDRKKLKSLCKKNTTKTSKTKAKGKKADRKLSDVEEEDENQVPDLEEGAQKKNEEGGSPDAEPKKKRKRKKKTDALTEEPSGKKNKSDLKSNEQSEAGTPEDSEATLPEDLTNADMTEKTPNVNTAKDAAIKPAKLSRGRAPKPLVPLGLKRGKKSVPPTKSKETVSEKGEKCESDGASKEQENKDELPLSQGSQRKSPCDPVSSEEDDTTVKPQKPTRYGRVPKPTQPLNYPQKEDHPSSASETTPASPSASKSKPKRTAKRGKSSKPQSAQKSKKPKLVTLRSSKSDFSDDEDENQWEDGDVQVHIPLACSSKDRDASVFVPVSLHASNPEISEVDDSMVELDILASMPDVLGISQDAMWPDSSCQQAQHEAGTAEPCEHQLDLLVDVIDFLSTEHSEVSQDESYNEAAQTLLTIGSLAHVSHSASETDVQDCATGTTSADVKESSNLEEGILSPELKQNVTTVSAAFGQEGMEATGTVSSLDLQSNVADGAEKPYITASELKATCDLEPDPQLQSNPDKSNKNPPLTTTGRFSKVKPKPNISRNSRTSHPAVQTEISKERKPEETHTVASNLSQVSEQPSATQETASKMSDSAQVSLKHDISMTEVKLMEESSDIKEMFDDQVDSVAGTSDQNSSVIHSSESHSEPRKDSATRDAESASDTTAETGLNKPSVSDSTMTEVVQESYMESVVVHESSGECPTPSAENAPVCQEEESKTVTSYQSKRSRLPKVKPKPNLPQTSKTTRSKPQTTQEIVEKDLDPTPNPEFHKTAEIESQATCTPSLTSQSTEELPASLEVKMCVGTDGQTVLDVEKSNLTVTEVQNFSKVQLEPIGETSRDAKSASSFTEENLTSHIGTTESSENVALIDLKLLKPPLGQKLTVDSALAHEGDGNPAEVCTSVKELIVSQEGCQVLSTSQSRRSRIQRVKPKPNLPQTSRAGRSKPQAAEEPVEKESSPDSDLHKKTTADVEEQQACTSSLEKQSESSDSASILKPSHHAGYMVGLTDQTDVDAPTSDQSMSENLNLPPVQLEPTSQQTARNKGSASEVMDESSASHDEVTERIPDQRVTESQARRESSTDSAAVREASSNPATANTPAEHFQAAQDKSPAASACLLRRSRLQKLKPKPNLPQTSRAARSKSEIIEEPAEEHSSPSTTQQQARILPSERLSESADHASVGELQTSDSTFTTTDELPVDEEKQVHTELIDQTEMEATTSDPSAAEIQKSSEVQLEPSREQTTDHKGTVSEFLNKDLITHTETSESCCSKTVTFDSEKEASQVGQMSHGESASVQEQNDSPVVLPVSKQDVGAASASQLKRSRLQKLKPKPNLPQTSRAGRSKPQAAEEPVEKELSPDSDLHKKTTADVEERQACTSSLEKQSESSDSASILKPSHHAGYMVGLTDQTDVDAPTSDQSMSENLNLPPVQLEPTSQQTARNKGSASEVMDESSASHDEVTERIPDQRVTESQARRESSTDSAAVREASSNPATANTPAEHFQAAQDKSPAASACLLRRSRLQKLKPKPNLPQTSRAARSKSQTAKESAEIKPQPSCSTLPEKQSQNTDAELAGKVDFGMPTSDQGASVKQNPFEVQPEPVLEPAGRETKNTHEFTEENLTHCVQTTESSLNLVASSFAQSVFEVTEDPVSHIQLVKAQSPTLRPESTEDTVTEVEAQPACSSIISPLETSTAGCASDSVPLLDLASAPSCTGELSSADEKLKTNVGVGQVLTSDCTEQNVPQRRQRIPKLKPKPNLASPSRITVRKPKADDGCKPSEDQQTEASSTALEESGGNRSGTDITVEKKSALDKVSNDQEAEMSSVSHEDFKMDVSTDVASSNNQPIINQTAASDVQASTQDDSCESRVNPLLTSAASHTCSQQDSSVQGMGHTELTDSPKTANKPPQTRRGRLVKPKPNLRCSSRPQQPPQAQSTDSRKADSDSCSQVDEKRESDLRPDHQESVKEFIDKLCVVDSSSNDAQVTEGCETQLTSSQNTLTSGIEGIQSYPLLSQILPEQVPSDPDEPFFILSLTEIPVSSAGDVLNSPAEHLSYPRVTDASKQQPIDSGESSSPGGGLVSNVPVHVSTKESDTEGIFNVKDAGSGPAVSISEAERNSLSLQKDLQVHPELVDGKESDPDSGRKAKMPVKSGTRKKKQMAPAASEAKSPTSQTSTTQDSNHPETLVRTVGGDKATVAHGKEPDTSLQTAQSVGRSCQNRKAREFPSYVSETKVTSSGKAASQRAKVKTASAAGKLSSEMHDVAPTQSLTPNESRSTSTTLPAQSLNIDQASDHRHICSDPTPSTSDSKQASQEGDSAETTSLEEEPTIVSQYFLSDIFTEVEEG